MIRVALSLVHLLAVLAWPFMPESAEKILREQLNVLDMGEKPVWMSALMFDIFPPGHSLGGFTNDILFKKIDTGTMTRLRRAFGGAQV